LVKAIGGKFTIYSQNIDIPILALSAWAQFSAIFNSKYGDSGNYQKVHILIVGQKLIGGGAMTLKSKRSSIGYGLIEIRESSILGWYALYINNELKEQSADLNYIQRQYDKY
jgi:hypothetical protein